MSKDLIAIGWTENIATAYRRMSEHKIRHLPIHNEFGQVVGVLSDRDVNRAMIMDPASESIEFDADVLVRDFMSWPVKYVEQDSDLSFVVKRMIVEKVSSLIVRKGMTAVGIITTEDLLKVLSNLLANPMTPAEWTLNSFISGIDSASQRLASTVI